MASSAIISGHRGRPALLLGRRLHLLPAILPALRTRAMRQHGLSTVRAGADVGCGRLPMGAPLVPLLPAGTLLRNTHSLLLLLQLDALQGRPARIDDAAVAAARASIEVLATLRAKAETIVPAERRKRNVEKDLLADRGSAQRLPSRKSRGRDASRGWFASASASTLRMKRATAGSAKAAQLKGRVGGSQGSAPARLR